MVIDNALLEAVADGDERAFTIVYLDCAELVLIRIAKIIKDEDAAQDLTQEIFIGLKEKLKTRYDYRKGGFISWLKVISKNAALNYLKNRPTDCEFNEEIVRPDRNYSVFTFDELKDGVLDDKEYEVLYHRFVLDETLYEIGKQKGWSIDKVKKISSRALKKVKAFYLRRLESKE